jgi:DNA-binding CsgD family transcriptional regulator
MAEPLSVDELSWPFVGRSGALDVLSRVWRIGSDAGILLEGPAGVGKTRLADALLAQIAETDDITVVRCVASVASQHVSFGAISHWLPDGGAELPTSHPGKVLAQVRQSTGGRRVVVMVDDIVFLDEPSVTLFASLLALGELFLIGTRRDEQPIPPAVDSLMRSFDLQRFVVQPLDNEALAVAAEAVLGRRLDAHSLERLLDRSAGNPLYAKELVLQAITTASLHINPSGTVQLEMDTMAPRLIELVRQRIDDLAPELIEALELIAVAEPLLDTDIERAGLIAPTTRLEQLGIVRLDRQADDLLIRVAHPLHGEVVRASMGELKRRHHLLAAAAIIRQRPLPWRDDPVRVALWELDAGRTPDRSDLIAAAERARAVADIPTTRRLAEAAHHCAPGVDSQVLLFESLFLLGEFDAAELVGAQPLPPDADVPTLITMMMTRMDNVLWGMGEPAAAEALVESYRPSLSSFGLESIVDIPKAFIAAINGRSAHAVELLGDEPDNPMIFLLASTALINAAIQRGRFADARRMCRRAIDMLDAMRDPRGTMDGRFFVINEALVAADDGSLREAIATCDAAQPGVLAERLAFMRCFLASIGGVTALRAGYLDRADAWFAELDAVTTVVPLPAGRRLAVAGRAAVAGQRGDAAACRTMIDRFESVRTNLRWMETEVRLGFAWAHIGVDEPAAARELARTAAKWAIDADEPVDALCALVECCRLGDGPWAASQLGHIATVTDLEGPSMAAFADLVRAHNTRRADLFADLAARLASLDHHLLAAETASIAARHFEAEGRRRDAERLTALANSELRYCPGAATPALSIVRSVSPLTKREMEIARMAADGHTSREIASRAFLSPRTVENHLHRVYSKLGVSTRDELSSRLDAN